MALEYDIYINSEIESDILITEALESCNLNTTKKNTENTMDLWDLIGFNIIIPPPFLTTYEIKGISYSFNKFITIRFNKFFEDKSSREKVVFTILKHLIKKSSVYQILFIFNSETLILLKTKNGLKLNSNSGFISNETISIFEGINFTKENFETNDINPI